MDILQLFVDFYPYHLAASDRRHWFRYSNNDLNHWLKEAMKSFNYQIADLFPKPVDTNSQMDTENFTSPRRFSTPASRLSEQLSKLMSTCLVVKIQDICMYKVTTSSKETPTPFISSKFVVFHIVILFTSNPNKYALIYIGYLERPKDVSAVNMEFTWFYNPGGVNSPCPSPKFYTQVNPLQIHLDVLVCYYYYISLLCLAIPQKMHQIPSKELIHVFCSRLYFGSIHLYPTYSPQFHILLLKWMTSI